MIVITLAAVSVTTIMKKLIRIDQPKTCVFDIRIRVKYVNSNGDNEFDVDIRFLLPIGQQTRKNLIRE